jgi:glucose 1-dehydrogenase
MSNGYEGKSVLVTGAGVGIGYALCKAYAERGARVALNDLDTALAARAAATINQAVGAERVMPYGLDVADVGAIRAMVDDIMSRCGRLDICVANAGITNYGPFLDYTPEAFDRLTSVNLRGSYFTAQAAARAMIAGGVRGRIVLQSSVTGVIAFPNLSAYGITKAAIRHLAQCLGLELGPYGITVNAIAPGAVATERTLADDPRYDANWSSVTPTGRPGTVDDVVAVALFLSSDAASHVNGQSLTVDGGWTNRSPIPDDHPDTPTAGSQLR